MGPRDAGKSRGRGHTCRGLLPGKADPDRNGGPIQRRGDAGGSDVAGVSPMTVLTVEDLAGLSLNQLAQLRATINPGAIPHYAYPSPRNLRAPVADSRPSGIPEAAAGARLFDLNTERNSQCARYLEKP